MKIIKYLENLIYPRKTFSSHPVGLSALSFDRRENLKQNLHLSRQWRNASRFGWEHRDWASAGQLCSYITLCSMDSPGRSAGVWTDQLETADWGGHSKSTWWQREAKNTIGKGCLSNYTDVRVAIRPTQARRFGDYRKQSSKKINPYRHA